MVLEHVLTMSGVMVRITFSDKLSSELHIMVSDMCELALEQWEEDGHPGWSVLGWEASYLRTYLLAQVSYATCLAIVVLNSMILRPTATPSTDPAG